MGNEDDERLSIVYFFATLRQLKSELAAAPAQLDQWSVDMMYSVQVTSSCKVPIWASFEQMATDMICQIRMIGGKRNEVPMICVVFMKFMEGPVR